MAGASQHAIRVFTGEPRLALYECPGDSGEVVVAFHSPGCVGMGLSEGSRSRLHAGAEEENLGCWENTVFSEQTFEIEQE